MPAAAQVAVRYQWCCFRPATADGRPVIDRVPGVDNAWVSAGHDGDGLLMAPATGQALATWIATGQEPQQVAISDSPGSTLTPSPKGRFVLCRSRGGVFSMRWGGGQPPIRVSGQPPAALMDRPMMGPAHQDQIGQVGRATMGPVAEMMGLTPARGPLAARDRTAAVADHQGGPLGSGHDPAGPAHRQRLGRATPKDRREPPGRRPQLGGQPATTPQAAVQ